METIKDRYNKILISVQKVCNCYVSKFNNKKNRKDLERDIKKAIDRYKKDDYIDKFKVDCGEQFNSSDVIKRGEISFMFSIIWQGKKEAARHTFGLRK